MGGFIAQYENGKFSNKTTCCQAPIAVYDNPLVEGATFHGCTSCKQEVTIMPVLGATLTPEMRRRVQKRREERARLNLSSPTATDPADIAWQWHTYITLNDYSDYIDTLSAIQDGTKPENDTEKAMLGAMNSIRIVRNIEFLDRPQLAEAVKQCEEIVEGLLTEAYVALSVCTNCREILSEYSKLIESTFGKKHANKFSLMSEMEVKL